VKTKFLVMFAAVALSATASISKVTASTFVTPVNSVVTIFGEVVAGYAGPLVRIDLDFVTAPSFPGCSAVLNQCGDFNATFASISMLTSISEYDQSGNLIDSHQIGIFESNCANNGFCRELGEKTVILGGGVFASFNTPVNGLSLVFSTEINSINVQGTPLLRVDLPDNLTTPLPAALPLFATGLGALGLLGWRRKRKAAAIAAKQF
jgi:hypothetical protein